MWQVQQESSLLPPIYLIAWIPDSHITPAALRWYMPVSPNSTTGSCLEQLVGLLLERMLCIETGNET
jgi:hypothetical protein